MESEVTVTHAELLDALAAATKSTAPEDAKTTPELCEALGLSGARVRKALAAMQAQGRLIVHNVRRPNISGRITVVPAYTIAPAPKKPKKR